MAGRLEGDLMSMDEMQVKIFRFVAENHTGSGSGYYSEDDWEIIVHGTTLEELVDRVAETLVESGIRILGDNHYQLYTIDGFAVGDQLFAPIATVSRSHDEPPLLHDITGEHPGFLNLVKQSGAYAAAIAAREMALKQIADEKARREAEKSKIQAEAKEKQERETYLRLKAKFEGGAL